jgi:hypothetical protein
MRKTEVNRRRCRSDCDITNRVKDMERLCTGLMKNRIGTHLGPF